MWRWAWWLAKGLGRPIAALLDTLGLPAALQHLAGEFDAAGGTAFKATVQGDEVDLPESVKTALFRIAQEAMNNAARHARAQHVSVLLRFEPQGGLALEIQDDGEGFDAVAAQAVMQHLPRQCMQCGGNAFVARRGIEPVT